MVQSNGDVAYSDGDTAQSGLCSMRFCPMLHLWEDQTAEGTWSSTLILQSVESEDRWLTTECGIFLLTQHHYP